MPFRKETEKEKTLTKGWLTLTSAFLARTLHTFVVVTWSADICTIVQVYAPWKCALIAMRFEQIYAIVEPINVFCEVGNAATSHIINQIVGLDNYTSP